MLRNGGYTKQPILNAPTGDTHNSTGWTWNDVGKYIKELHDEYKSLGNAHDKIRFIKNNILKINEEIKKDRDELFDKIKNQ